MITTIVFSKDRAAQLDLLLSSCFKYAPDLGIDTHVIWAASNQQFNDGYQTCIGDYRGVRFHPETDFERNLYEVLTRAEKHVMFLCDDDIFYRHLKDPFPTTILDWCPDVLTVSLRLGLNTVNCYSLNRSQALPEIVERQRSSLSWEWRGAEADWGYPGSLDGNVWRTEDIVSWLGSPSGPNNFEEMLNSACHGIPKHLAACYTQSILFGNPVNMVNSTHRANRYGEQWSHSPLSLNAAYLDGMRLSTNSIDPGIVVAAHCEQQLHFNPVRLFVV